MSFLDTITSINSYTFNILIILLGLFTIAKAQGYPKIIQKINQKYILSIIIGVLIFIFYFIGWESFGHHRYVPHKGEKITFSKTQMAQICNLHEVIKFIGGAISPLEAYRYNCYITKANSSLLSYYPSKFKKIGKMQKISKNKKFTIVDYVYIKTHGILLKSFAGPGVSSYVLIDENNTTFIVYDGYIESEKNK